MAITKEQIFQAADELDSIGLKPTYVTVREKLGRASFSSITEGMKEWKKLKASQSRETSLSEPVPASIADRLAELVAGIWRDALNLADQRLAADREKMNELLHENEAEKAETIQLADQLSAELDDSKRQMAIAESSANLDKAEILELRNQLATLTQQYAVSEARALESEKRANDLNNELARVNDQNNALIKLLPPPSALISKKGRPRKEL